MILAELQTMFDPEPHPGAYNMAVDEVLLRTVRRPTLRVYQWSEPAVSLGYFNRYAEAAEEWPGRTLVRRWTGGGVVPHGADFTYTLVVPHHEEFARLPSGETYRLIHEAVRCGIGEVAGTNLAPASAPKVSAQCFENPAQYDLLAGGSKIAGAAQRRTREGLLHQGSIQVNGLGAAFADRLASNLAQVVEKMPLLSKEQSAAARQLVLAKYGSPAWQRRY